jgi:membrane protein YqaA with SNARE-associated domain
MMRRLYEWTMRQAEGPHALWVLAAVSFVESSVFPIPPDILMIPMIIARPHKAWLIALVCTVASVLGGFAGYAIGFGAFETIGRPVLEFYGKMDQFDTFRDWFNAQGAWAVLFAGVTPFPYKVVTITSGATGLDLVVFGVASLIARGLRFFVIAGLLYFFGARIRAFIERYFGILTIVFFILLIGGFMAVKYVM